MLCWVSVKASVLEAIARLTARDHLLIVSSRGATMDGSPDKLAALVDVVRALDRLDVPHALVGGVAVGMRSGVPRATLDTDIAVPSTVSPESVRDTLTGAGFSPIGSFAHSMKFRHHSGEPVQIVFDPAFDPMIERAEPLEVAGVRVRVVTTADLIAMKERAAADPARRPSKALRDRADIALLRGDVPDPDEGW
jgi:Nucleotidyl transferase AbiEii toxin, Type IV TA system